MVKINYKAHKHKSISDLANDKRVKKRDTQVAK